MGLYVQTKPMKVGESVLYPGDRLPDEARGWRALRHLMGIGLVSWAQDSPDESYPFGKPLVTTTVPTPVEPSPVTIEEASSFDPGEETVKDVLAYVADNPEAIEDVLATEQEGKNRSSLVSKLQDMLVEGEEGPDGSEG